MVERIEPVSRVKGVDNDVGKPFSRKDGYNDTGQGKSFAEILKNTIKSKEIERGIPAAYSLDISVRATQSLFYENMTDIGALANRLQLA